MSYTPTTPVSNKTGSDGSGLVIGPFVGGVPTQVPLWVAKTLHQRRLVQVDRPDWLTAQSLKRIIHEERTSEMLSTSLPYHYYEIALALQWLLDPQTQILLQDLSSLRVDKLRQHFHIISRSTLEQPQGLVGDDDDEEEEDDDEYYGDGIKSRNSNNIGGGGGAGRDVMPTINTTGIGSYELNTLGPFFQRAFSDYGYLTTRMSQQEYEKYYVDDDDEHEHDGENDDHDVGGQTRKDANDVNVHEYQDDNDVDDEDDNDDGFGDYDTTGYNANKDDANLAGTTGASSSLGGSNRKIVGGRSRLRRFR